MRSFETRIRAVMEALVEEAMTELGRLLEEQREEEEAAQQRPVPVTLSRVKREDGAPEQPLKQSVTNQFAALMETWTKEAVEKILTLLTLCEAGDGTNKKTPKAPKQKSAARRRGERTKKNGAAKNKENDHGYYRDQHQTKEPTTETADSQSLMEPAAHEESISGSVCELSAEMTSDLFHVGEEEVVQVEPDTNRKRQTGPFTCPSCDKTFARKCLMERHLRTHSKPHLCPECGKGFADIRGLVAHSRRHTGEKLYRCSDCGTEFAYKHTFTRHMRRHSAKTPNTHACPLCDDQFPGQSALQRHRCCALKKTFVCSVCPQTFQCRQSLADHENLHSGARGFVCETCGESFLSFSSLATHRVTHAQKETCCDVLGLGCSDISVLRTHLSKHTGEKLFPCEVCGKGCGNQAALKHHALKHTGERPYVCDTCGKRCGHASALQNHMRVHTGRKPGQPPVCGVCGKKIGSMVKLKYHMSIHTGEKPYACAQCDKRFRNPSNLKLHAAVHSGEKPYGCNICGRRFTQANSLKLHRRIHTGEKPYGCAACGKDFTHRSDFRKHQRTHLPQETGSGEKTAAET